MRVSSYKARVSTEGYHAQIITRYYMNFGLSIVKHVKTITRVTRRWHWQEYNIVPRRSIARHWAVSLSSKSLDLLYIIQWQSQTFWVRVYNQICKKIVKYTNYSKPFQINLTQWKQTINVIQIHFLYDFELWLKKIIIRIYELPISYWFPFNFQRHNNLSWPTSSVSFSLFSHWSTTQINFLLNT